MLIEGQTFPSGLTVYDAKCAPRSLPHPLWAPAKKAKEGEPQLPDPPKRHALVVFVPGTHDGVDEQSLCGLRDMIRNSAKTESEAGATSAPADSPFLPRIIDAASKKSEPALIEVYAISVESTFANKGIVARGKLPFPIYSDYSREVSRAIVGTELDFGSMPGYEVANRAVLLVDPNDVCVWSWLAPAPGIQPVWDDVRKMALQELRRWNAPKDAEKEKTQ